MSNLIGTHDLDRIRRRRRKTLSAVAALTGLSTTSVWRVLNRSCADLRMILPVVKAIGVSVTRLDIEDFISKETLDPAPPKAGEDSQKATEREPAGDEGPTVEELS